MFGLEVNWDLLQARMVEREAEEEAHKEQVASVHPCRQPLILSYGSHCTTAAERFGGTECPAETRQGDFSGRRGVPGETRRVP